MEKGEHEKNIPKTENETDGNQTEIKQRKSARSHRCCRRRTHQKVLLWGERMKDYKESLIDALDIVKDSKRCLGCVGSCNECEYFLAIEKIENAIERLGELVEKETTKPLDYEGDGYVDGELNYDTAICRSCGRKFEVDYDEHSKYCPNCGQKLDWGENDD